MTHHLATARWYALLADTAPTPEESNRWRQLAEQARARAGLNP